MHGMDLGYDNKIVAAKTWAALFAAREWALKAEQGLLEEQPEEPKKSWREVFHGIDELNKVKSIRVNGFHVNGSLKKKQWYWTEIYSTTRHLSTTLRNFFFFGNRRIMGRWGTIFHDT